MSQSLSTIPAIGATLLLAAALIVDVHHDIRRLVSGRSAVLVGIFSWFLLEALTLSPELRQYPQRDYNYGVLCVVVSILAFLAGYHATGGCPWFCSTARKVGMLDDPRSLWKVVLFCGLLGFAPILFYSGMNIVDLLHGILGMRQTWGGVLARERYGGFREALLQLENLVTGVGPFAFLLLLDRRSTLAQRLFCAVVAVWPVLRGWGNGTRFALLMAVLPIAAVLYFRAGPRQQRGLIIIGLWMIPLLYSLMAAIVASRDLGEFDWNARKNAEYVGSEMFQELIYITDHVPGEVPYQAGYSYLVQICSPVPRFVWPGKPSLETGIMLAELRGEVDRHTGEAYYTRAPGILGEMYLNFGIPGLVLLNAFGGWIVRGWDRIARKHASSLSVMVFHVAGLGALFFTGRSINLSVYYPLAFFAAAVWFLSWQASSYPVCLRGQISLQGPRRT